MATSGWRYHHRCFILVSFSVRNYYCAIFQHYRCKDNGLVRIDWLQGGKGAYLHGDGYAQTHLKPAEVAEGQPASSDLTAEGGYILKGEAKAASVSLTLPGKGAQTCHV